MRLDLTCIFRDDCPRWADWTCAASTGGNQRRSALEEAAFEHRLSKRGFSPEWISVKDHKQRGLRKMPLGIRRGGSKSRHVISSVLIID